MANIIDNSNTRDILVLAGETDYFVLSGAYSQLIIEVSFIGASTILVQDSIDAYSLLLDIQDDLVSDTASWRNWINGTITDASTDDEKIGVAYCPNGIKVINSGANDVLINIKLNK